MPSFFDGLSVLRVRSSKSAWAATRKHSKPRRDLNPDAPNTASSFGLCQYCQELNLRPEKFRVSTNNCGDDESPTRDVDWKQWEDDFELLSGAEPLRREVAEMSSQCRFCQLIQQAILSYSGTDSNLNGVQHCFIEWDLDGPNVEPPTKFENTSRRLRIFWTRKVMVDGVGEKDLDEEVYFSHVPSKSQSQPAAPDYKDDDKRCEELILKWLRACETKHTKPNLLSQGDSRKNFRSLVRSSSFGVIDVVEKRLCRLPMEDGEPASFVALSYVWGPDSQNRHAEVKATRANNRQRRSEGGLQKDWEMLPRTVRDAIRLVTVLGQLVRDKNATAPPLRYLWVDLLCIVQDSKLSWKQNAEKMHLIYGNAHFTICAADGANSAAGLVALDPTQKEAPLSGWVEPDLRLIASKVPEDIIAASEWNHRAWTYQERILSRRCVVFAGRKLYFQCHEMNWSQDEDSGGVGNGMASASRISPLRALGMLESRPICFYMTSVRDYTGRNLGRATDILNAFNGVAQLIEQYLCSDFVFGLPTSHFDLALLWKPLAGKRRRTLDKLRQSVPAMAQDWEEDLEFPSWSWSGWMDFADPGKGAGAEYDPTVLAGCLANLRDWLLNRTWIVWHIRDSNGDLRLLWDGTTHPLSGRREATWSGYKSRPRTGYGWWRYIDAPENRVGLDEDPYGRSLESTARKRVRGLLECRKPPAKDPEKVETNDLMDITFKDVLLDSHFGVPEDDDDYDDDTADPSNFYHPKHGLTENRRRCQPILQFFTLSCDFRIVKHRSKERQGLQKYYVADNRDDCCGTVNLDKTWVEENQVTRAACRFIALSEAKSFSKDEWAGWTHYLPTKRDDSDWTVFYVMMIAKDPTRGHVWERVGLGKIFQEAFRINSCTWEEIMLG